MLKKVVVFLMFLMSVNSAFADTNNSPVGTWLTIDDNTHKPTALIQIMQGNDGTLIGKALKGLRPTDSSERRCIECTDERKNQKIQGMTIMKNMKRDGDEWDGGKILDPDIGTEYRCKMHLEDGGQKLVVRGYIGFSLLGRSQVWIRKSNINE